MTRDRTSVVAYEAESAPQVSNTRAGTEAWLCAYLAREFGITDVDPSSDEPLANLGIDSVDAVRLVADLEEWLGRALPPTLFSDAETVVDFVDFVSSAPESDAAAPARRPYPERSEIPATSRFARFVNPHLARLLERLHLDKCFVRGEGLWLFDDAGRRYLDFMAQYGALPFGFNPSEIWSALLDAQRRSDPCFVQPSLLDVAAELAERLIGIAPEPLRYVTFTNSGAEAIEVAIKICRGATGRPGVLSTERGFHGKTLAALSATGNPEYQEPFGLPFPDFHTVPFGNLVALRAALETRPGFYAAFVVEPIQGEGGVIEAPPGYLAAAKQVCAAHGVLFVVDEVQTGLGRTGAMFACEADEVAPDVMTLAKALGGGLIPIGACLVREDAYLEAFGLKHSSTFAGNTLAARVGLATLAVLERDDRALIRQVAENGAWMKRRLEELRLRFPDRLVDVRGRGYMLGLRFAFDRDRSPYSYVAVAAQQDYLAPLIASYLLNAEALRVAPTLNGRDVIRIEPALVATRADCETACAALERMLEILDTGNTGRIWASIVRRTPCPASSVPFSGRTATRATRAPGDAPFAFLVHPLTSRSHVDFDDTLRSLADAEIEGFHRSVSGLLEPFVVSSAKITSRTGRTAYGEFIAISRAAAELLTMPSREVQKEVGDAVALARRRGARLVGLGGYASVATAGGLKLADLPVSITTGNSFTAVAGYAALTLALGRVGLPPMQATAAVVGATGSIGRALALLLSEGVERLILIGNPQRAEAQTRRRLSAVASRVCRHVVGAGRRGRRYPTKSLAATVLAMKDVPSADAPLSAFDHVVTSLQRDHGQLILSNLLEPVVPLADCVVTATSFPGALLPVELLRRGAVVCDLSRPRNVDEHEAARRPDVIVIDGGLVEVPGRPEIGPLGLPEGMAYACMAETMILALEQRFENASLGGDLTPEFMLELHQASERHGFRITRLCSFGRALQDGDWARVAR